MLQRVKQIIPAKMVVLGDSDPDGQEWVEESAMIDYNFESYTDEQMIEELDRRGYIVQKKPQND